jgi:hypothetical protein
MRGAGPGRTGQLVLFLAILNGALLVSGLALEYWLNQPRELPEFNAERIRLLGQPGSGQAVEKSEPAASNEATEPSEAAEPPVACLKIADFDQSRYREIQGLLESAGIAPQQRRYLVGQSLGWWVFWPPEYEALQRDKTLQAIRAAGVRDAVPITKGPMAQAYSLGVFASEDQALLHRNRLRSRGLDKAEFGPRPGVAGKEVHLLCRLGGQEQFERLMAGLPAGVSQVERGECPEALEGERQ